VNPQLHEGEVRQDLVARVRQEIQAGTYDTPDKMEAALDRLAARISLD
jgi:anti-sigma28 factor (negative regulator of flagellin synthesis)